MLVGWVDSEGKLAELLAKAVSIYSETSGETPTMLIDFEEDGLLCHSSLIKAFYPYLHSCIEKFFIKSDDMEKDTGSTEADLSVKKIPISHLNKVKMVSLIYFVYTRKMVEVARIVRILDLTLFSANYKVLDLVKLGIGEISLRDKSGVKWTYVQGVGAGSSYVNNFLMNSPFETSWKVPNVSNFGKIPCRNYAPTDLWDFKGKSIGCGKTPRQMGFVEDDLNFLEFDQISFNLLKKDGQDTKDFVKIDFEVENVETKRGIVVSPTVQVGEFWWMILVEFPKKQMDGTDPDPGVYLVCKGPHKHGGGASWSCEVVGSIRIVNCLDRTKDICNNFKLTSFSNDYDESGFLFPDLRKDESTIINNSLIIKVRVLVDNYKINYSPRYKQILGRRKSKEARSSGVMEDIDAGQGTLRTKKISPITKAAGVEQIMEETDELPEHGKIDNHSEINGTEVTLTESKGDRKEMIPSACGEAVFKTEKCEKLVKDAEDESDCFKQDICQSLGAMALDRDRQASVEEFKIKKVVKKKKAVIGCYLPSCTESARHRCSRCLGVRYCSQGCSDQHWAVHREECRHMEERLKRDREAGLD